jgi:MFS family permease
VGVGLVEKEDRRTIRGFAAASFLNDFGSDMIYPVWPLFVTLTLGANMEILGFIDGLGDALVSLSQAASGYASDRLRRRKVFVWTGYLCGAVSRVGYGLTTVWQQLIPFRILDRAGKMRGAPRDAMIADASTDEDRGKHFGLLRAMDNLGAVFGILLCLALLTFFGWSYRSIFLAAAIPSVIAVVLVLVVIREKRATGRRVFKGFSLKDIDNNFRLFLVLSALFALASFSYSFLLIFATRAGFATWTVPLLYLVFTVFAAVFSYPFGRFADRVGRKNVLFISYGFWGGICMIFIFVQAYWAILLTFVLYGLHRAAIEPVQRTLVSEIAPVQFRASSLGTFQLVIGLFALPASLTAGLLWDTVGPAVPFMLSLVLTIVSGVLLLFVKEHRTLPLVRPKVETA